MKGGGGGGKGVSCRFGSFFRGNYKWVDFTGHINLMGMRIFYFLFLRRRH